MMNLSMATVVACVLGICHSIGNLIWNIPLLTEICWNSTEGTHFRALVPTHLKEIKNLFEVFGAGLLFLILSLLIIIFAYLCLKANLGLKEHWLHCFWITTLTKSALEALGGFYFFFRSFRVVELNSTDGIHVKGPARFEADAYYVLAIFFSGIYFFWAFVNFIFSMLVVKRVGEIRSLKKKIIKKIKSASNADELTPLTASETSPPPDYTRHANYQSVQDLNQENLDEKKSKKTVWDIIDYQAPPNPRVINPRDYERLL